MNESEIEAGGGLDEVGEDAAGGTERATGPEAAAADSMAAGEPNVAGEPDEERGPGDDTEERPGLEKSVEISEGQLKSVLESLIFVADKPVPLRQLARSVKTKGKTIKPLLAELVAEYEGRGIQLVEVGGGFQFRSSVANAPFVRAFVQRKPVRLSRAQLETLAIVSYRQPVTRPEIDDIRGVDSGSSLKVLLERGLLKVLGRKDEPGRPLLYGTSPTFLDFFGLKSLKELPTLKEFTELSDESRGIFSERMGEDVDFSKVEEAAKAAEADAQEEFYSIEELDEPSEDDADSDSHGEAPEREDDADSDGEEGSDDESGDEDDDEDDADSDGEEGSDDESGDEDDDADSDGEEGSDAESGDEDDDEDDDD